jgi:hypothetical protein
MIRRFSTAAATQAWVAPLTSVPGAVLQIRTARNAPRPQGGSGMMHRSGNGNVLILKNLEANMCVGRRTL